MIKVTIKKAKEMLETSKAYYESNDIYPNYAALKAAEKLVAEGQVTINNKTWVVA